MPDLVTLSELKAFLGETSSDNDVMLAQLLEHIEALLEIDAGRQGNRFTAAQNGRTEVRDSTGSPLLFLDYAVATLTSVKLGYDPANPDETLDVSNKLVVVWAAGSKQLSRTDGGIFGRIDRRRYVQIVYDAQADLPEECKLAIKSVCATAYRRRGSEDAKSETVDGFSHDLVQDITASDPFWQRAVNANRGLVFA